MVCLPEAGLLIQFKNQACFQKAHELLLMTKPHLDRNEYAENLKADSLDVRNCLFLRWA